jgi:pimeloyl-ACP methyl ester carboxylesterase
LVLLHGGFGTITMFNPLLPMLSKIRSVIVVELQGHGHTADIDRPFSFEVMADDIAGLIRQIGYDKVDVAGYSLGGGVALQTAIRHPNSVRKLILMSTPYKRQGWYPEVLMGMASISVEGMSATPIYSDYTKIAPNPADWVNLVNKTRQLLSQDYDWTQEVVKLQAPTLIIAGDADSLPPTHAVELFSLLGGGQIDGASGGLPKSQLAILPGTTHFSILERTDLLQNIIPPFLSEE